MTAAASAAFWKGLVAWHCSGKTPWQAFRCHLVLEEGLSCGSCCAALAERLLTRLSELAVSRVLGTGLLHSAAGVAGCLNKSGAERANRSVLWDLPRAVAFFAKQLSAEAAEMIRLFSTSPTRLSWTIDVC